jgi:hypothetical protein
VLLTVVECREAGGWFQQAGKKKALAEFSSGTIWANPETASAKISITW